MSRKELIEVHVHKRHRVTIRGSKSRHRVPHTVSLMWGTAVSCQPWRVVERLINWSGFYPRRESVYITNMGNNGIWAASWGSFKVEIEDLDFVRPKRRIRNTKLTAAHAA